jgi:hypothetical protein
MMEGSSPRGLSSQERPTEVEELIDEVGSIERLVADHAGHVLVLLALLGGPEAAQELARLGVGEPFLP